MFAIQAPEHSGACLKAFYGCLSHICYLNLLICTFRARGMQDSKRKFNYWCAGSVRWKFSLVPRLFSLAVGSRSDPPAAAFRFHLFSLCFLDVVRRFLARREETPGFLGKAQRRFRSYALVCITLRVVQSVRWWRKETGEVPSKEVEVVEIPGGDSTTTTKATTTIVILTPEEEVRAIYRCVCFRQLNDREDEIIPLAKIVRKILFFATPWIVTVINEREHVCWCFSHFERYYFLQRLFIL